MWIIGKVSLIIRVWNNLSITDHSAIYLSSTASHRDDWEKWLSQLKSAFKKKKEEDKTISDYNQTVSII